MPWSGIKLLRLDPRTGKPFGHAPGPGPGRAPKSYALAARPAYGLEDPPLASAPSQIADPVLAEMISRFARDARHTRHN